MGYDAEYLAYQMKYDSIHGRYDGTVEVDGDSLVIDGQKVALSHTRDPAEIPFTEYGAEYVCESTGVFLTEEKIQPHLKAGAVVPPRRWPGRQWVSASMVSGA